MAVHGAQALVLALVMVSAPGRGGQPSPALETGEVLAEVRVHGNHTTPDADIVALSGLRVGAPLLPGALASVEQRLMATRRFSDVEVRKRYRSLTDTRQVVLVLLVTEPARASDAPRSSGPLRALRDALMFLPVLDYEDGYGFTYGGRATFADLLGRRGHLAVPLTWGGVRRVALEGDKRFTRGPIGRLEAAASLSQRENPHFRLNDRRTVLAVRGERAIGRGLRVGAGLGWTEVSFGGPAEPGGPPPAFDLDDRFVTLGADITLDTRVDPAFPRDAVFVRAGWDALRFDPETVHRARVDARGYVGLVGQSVLSIRALHARADAPLPPYEQWLLGGASTLRGSRAGAYAGDSLLAASAEVRVPLTSPLRIGKAGVSVFVDTGAVAPYGSPLRDQRMRSGAGAGLFFLATVVQFRLEVAHAFDGGTRVHVTTGLTF